MWTQRPIHTPTTNRLQSHKPATPHIIFPRGVDIVTPSVLTGTVGVGEDKAPFSHAKLVPLLVRFRQLLTSPTRRVSASFAIKALLSREGVRRRLLLLLESILAAIKEDGGLRCNQAAARSIRRRYSE